MINPILRLCPACLGEGEIESIPNPESSIDNSSKKAKFTKCPSCKGEGYVETGMFILEKNDPRHFKTLFDSLAEDKKEILRNFALSVKPIIS